MDVKKYSKQIERKKRMKKIRRNSRERKYKERINWGGKSWERKQKFCIKEIKNKKSKWKFRNFH